MGPLNIIKHVIYILYSANLVGLISDSGKERWLGLKRGTFKRVRPIFIEGTKSPGGR